jgi:prevent-host-death family protein
MGMRSIGVRELKQRTSEIVRRVRTSGESVEVTVRGEVMALLVPVRRRKRSPKSLDALSTSMDRLAREIGARWPKGAGAADEVSAGRRG